VDVDNFDKTLKGMKPRVAFSVPNLLGGTDGKENLLVNITFEKLEDFSPAAVARKIDGLKDLLEARRQRYNLMSYMDGKSGAEDLIARVIKDPTLWEALAAAPKPAESEALGPEASSAQPTEGEG
jgi:type VI secretion system protein ImpB